MDPMTVVFIDGPLDGSTQTLTPPGARLDWDEAATPFGVYTSDDDLDDQGRVVMRWSPVCRND